MENRRNPERNKNCQIVGNNTIHELLIQTDFLQWSSKKERKVNALAIGADEGRGKLR